MVLATLAAQNLADRPLAKSAVDITSTPQIQEVTDRVVPDLAKKPTTKEAILEQVRSTIATPESLGVPEFSPEALPASDFPLNPLTENAQNIVVPTVENRVTQGSRTAMALPETDPKLRSNIVVEIDPQTHGRTEAALGRILSAYSKLKTPSPLSTGTSTSFGEPEVPAAAQNIQLPGNLNSPNTARLKEAGGAREEEIRADLSTVVNSPIPQEPISSQPNRAVVTQNEPTVTQPCLGVESLKSQLRALENLKDQGSFLAAPALSIVIPTGFGADHQTGFVSATYQQRTRYTDVNDGAIGVGVGFGDAQKSVGVELSYAIASFGGSRDFGSGGFNIKLHRQLPNDFAVAVGGNGLLNLGSHHDFENSFYTVVTKVFRTQDDINLPFSRIAVTAGIGNGQFRTEDAVAKDENNINVFGSVAVRVAQQVSVIAEWSGQDLGVGVSIAPFKNIPLVITPAVRDLVGAGNGPRFVLGTGFAFKF